MSVSPIIWPDVPCCLGSSERDVGCACGPQERVMRSVVRGDVPLTPEQREWCLAEIAKVEGYDHADYLSDSDVSIARGVLSSWADYCRDKGLL